MKVLITGGAGFIGTHLTKAFANRGDKVTIIDNFSTGAAHNLESFAEVIEGDIRDLDLMDKEISKTDLVMHMAASLGVLNIMKNPIEAISSNLYGSEVVLNSCATQNKRIFIASTSEIYGKNPKQPISENDDRLVGPPQNHRWTYADTKALEESIATVLHRKKDLQVTILRFFNITGPGQRTESGMVLPRFVDSALRDSPLMIFGDGEQSRVFCHIDDAIEAIMKLVQLKSSIGEVFNIGGVEEIKMKDLAIKIISTLESKSIIKYQEYFQVFGDGYEDMARRVPDLTKINEFTQWKPNKTLKHIIEDVAKSIKC
jgi:UDP-glucose 4-epimerase